MGPAALAILVLVPPSFSPSATDLYDQARAALEAHTTFAIAPYDLFDDNLRRSAIGACANEPACFAALARRSGYEGQSLLVLSAAEVPDGPKLVAAKLISRRGELLGRSSQPLSDGLTPLLAAALAEHGWDRVGSLVVETIPPGAEVAVLGRSCVTPCRLDRLMPGETQVELRINGSTVRRDAITVSAGPPTRYTATLDVDKPTPFYATWWFWTATAVVAAGATTAAVVATRPDDGPDLVCLGRIDC